MNEAVQQSDGYEYATTADNGEPPGKGSGRESPASNKEGKLV